MVTDYETRHGGVMLDPSSSSSSGERDVTSGLHFSPRNSHTVSPAYAAVYALKAHLVMRMLEIRTGRELLLQVRTHRAPELLLQVRTHRT